MQPLRSKGGDGIEGAYKPLVFTSADMDSGLDADIHAGPGLQINAGGELSCVFDVASAVEVMRSAAASLRSYGVGQRRKQRHIAAIAGVDVNGDKAGKRKTDSRVGEALPPFTYLNVIVGRTVCAVGCKWNLPTRRKHAITSPDIAQRIVDSANGMRYGFSFCQLPFWARLRGVRRDENQIEGKCVHNGIVRHNAT